MALKMETRKYRLNGFTPILGSQPASSTLRTEFISSKAPSPARAAEEDDLLGDIEERGLTVFMRDDETNALIMMDYMIRGYFKGALEGLVAQTGIKQPRAKVDRFVFIGPRRIPILREDELILDEDDQLERPLRAETMRGPRTGLAASEMINPPWSVEFEVTLMPNMGNKSSSPVTWEEIETALDYGKFQGLGQWRNGGYGRFEWERTDSNPMRS